MSPQHIEDIYPLSPMQQGMLFHSLYAPESGVYVEQLSCALHGRLDAAAFERAWQRVMDRHSILRTAFMWEDLDDPLQVVHRQVPVPLVQQDWQDLSPADQEARLAACLAAEQEEGFDFAHAPLMRLALIRTGAESHRFVWTHHHILLDGWCLPLILSEVLTFYDAFRQGNEVELPAPRPFRDYIAWLEAQAQDPARAETYWRQQLRGFTAPTPLVVDRAPAGGDERAGGYEVLSSQLPEATTAALQALARGRGLTLSTLVQGAWALLLSRYSGAEEVLFGVTVSGRPADLPGAETMTGLFINTLPVRARVPAGMPAVAWLQGLQRQLAELRQYEYCPLVEVQGWSDVPRGLPLFESILVFENYPVDASLWEADRPGSLEMREVRSVSRTNYPLTVVANPGPALGLEVAYDASRFEGGAVRRLLGHLETLLAGIAAEPEGLISNLPLLTGPERRQLLVDWNDTGQERGRELVVHRLFEARAAQTPGALAVVHPANGPGEGVRSLTYAELDRRANRLAHYLRQLGVGPGVLVGLHLERSPEMIAGLLGVLKAGGAYLPLDPAYPAERLAFMLEDAQVNIVLSEQRLLETLPADASRSTPHAPRVVCLDADREAIARESPEPPVDGATPADLAYVIYTSGSTGAPKGVMVPHRALLNHALALEPVFDLKPGERLLQFISLSFDASAEEIFPTLLSGATLVLPPPAATLTGAEFLEFCEAQAINVLHLPASFWHQWVAELEAAGRPVRAPFRLLLLGGEPVAVDRLQAWSRLFEQPLRFLNAYGPTETTITATLFEAPLAEAAQAARIPIGRPLANVQVYLLDAALRPVPVGVPGELYIGGAGVARGYLNRPALTAEKFIPNPFILPPSREAFILYRTGDLARYRPDGNLEFLGRVDDQVKVRGFRVEPGEIAACLGRHPAVREAVVVPHETADRDGGAASAQLVAYVVPAPRDEGPAPGSLAGQLRDFLKEGLPAHMLPSFFVMMEALPRLPNGKVDRRALPPPEGHRPALATAYLAPRTPLEVALADLWAQVLGLARIGIQDDFFELGGHSLLATQLISRVREVFQVEVPLRDLFDAPTVAGLATRIEAARRAAAGLAAPPIEPVSRAGELPLSFAQQRLWFLDQLAPGNLFYNIPLAVRLTGRLDLAALERSLNEIVRRHEALRTTFALVNGKPVQVIAPALALCVPLPLDDLTTLPAPEREAEARRRAQAEVRQPFDLAQGPLLRARLLKLDEAEHIAVLTMHHIVSDGWSLGVLIGELAALYDAFSAGAESASPLPDLPIQYADFAHWQRTWLQGEVRERQLAYWRERLSGTPPLLDLPTDRPRPAMQSWRGATENFTLPPALLASLKALSREEGATLFMTLLAAFQTLLYRYTGQADVSVGTPIANRTRAEIEGLIGFFVNTLVMRTDLSGAPTFRQLLGRVREVALGAYAHQDLPFETLVETLQPQRNLSHTPLFQVMFVLGNTPVGPLELPDLTLSPVPADSGTATFDLTLSVAEGPDGLGGSLEYNRDLFEPATIKRMIDHWQTLLAGLVSDPDRSIAQLPLLTEAEQRRMLVEWNATATGFPRDRCIHELFEAQVERQPEALAAIFAPEPGAPFELLTYRALNERANQLAHYLRQLGVGPEVLVGLCTERSLEMVVGILGTLKAGGAYLPLDPAYPPDRLAFMLEDSQVTVLLTQARLLDLLPLDAPRSTPHAPRVVRLDADWEAIARESTETPAGGATPDNLAYVIYTSGSTGRPKGTMLAHRGLCNLTGAQRRAFGIRSASRVLQFSPLSFDASVWETFMALRNGATLCLAPQETLASGPELLRLLQAARVTNVTLPPSVLAALGEPARSAPLPALETVIAAGEACAAELVARWAPGRDFFDAYGPTETTVCASMHLCDEQDAQGAGPPIGRPIANTRLYVLDRDRQPVPAGVPGELHVGGVGLARGYLNRPDLTAERFVPDPFGEEPGARLYTTGDLVRYRPDGNVEFLGRIDHQVKVRGFRIELGEIETALRQHPGLRAGVVVAQAGEHGPGDQRLVAYVVPGQEPGPSGGELRRFLGQTLPEYMIPSVFVTLEALPLSPSGKVDRQGLPAPEGARPALETEYVAPRNETERRLADICAELLGMERVGVRDSFFELGGHSLLATQFISRVRDTFEVEVPLRTLFEHPTVAEFAEALEEARARGEQPAAPAMVPLSRERHRMSRSALSEDGGNGSATKPAPVKEEGNSKGTA